MPLSEFVRYLNAQQDSAASGGASSTPFVATDGQVSVSYAKLRLESRFAPIVDLSSGQLYGHAARLEVFGRNNHRLFEPDAVFVLPGDDAQFVYLDRLVRTLHTLNYLTYAERARGSLLLRVHPRQVASVASGHGLAFEEVLRSCGLLPEQITLEVEIDGGDDSAHLLRAVDNYKLRGYAIAVGRFGRRSSDFGLLREVGPSLVNFDAGLVAREALAPLVERVHELGARVMLLGDEGERARRDVDLLQLDSAAVTARAQLAPLACA